MPFISMGKIVLKKKPIESQVALGDLALDDPGPPLRGGSYKRRPIVGSLSVVVYEIYSEHRRIGSYNRIASIAV